MKPIISISAAIALAFGAAQFASAQDAGTPPSMESSPTDQPSFDQIDSDGDGQVSREEAAAAGLSVDWGSADSDGDGQLNQDEYDQATGTGGGGGMGGSPGLGTESPSGDMGSDPGLGSDPGQPSDPGTGGGM